MIAWNLVVYWFFKSETPPSSLDRKERGSFQQWQFPFIHHFAMNDIVVKGKRNDTFLKIYISYSIYKWMVMIKTAVAVRVFLPLNARRGHEKFLLSRNPIYKAEIWIKSILSLIDYPDRQPSDWKRPSICHRETIALITTVVVVVYPISTHSRRVASPGQVSQHIVKVTLLSPADHNVYYQFLSLPVNLGGCGGGGHKCSRATITIYSCLVRRHRYRSDT